MARKIGQVFGFNVNLSVRLGIVTALSVLVLLLCVGYALLPKDRDPLTFVALAITAAGTIGGTFYVAETIRDQGEQAKRTHAFEMMARWNSPDLFHSRFAWNKISHQFQQNGAGAVRTYLNDPANENDVTNIRHILNFIEEISIAVREDHADGPLLKRAFRSIVMRAHEALSDWISDHRRATARNDIWEEFEWLYSAWR
jgi:hypothetical protein